MNANENKNVTRSTISIFREKINVVVILYADGNEMAMRRPHDD